MKKLALGALFAALAACGGDGEKKPPTLIDAPPGGEVDAPPSAACDPLTQTGCADGEKCGWVRLQQEPFVGAIECVPDGAVATGGACMYNPFGADGYSNCAKGNECVANVCKSICDHNGGAPMCDDQHACSNYNNLFEQSDMTVAGVCDVKCDPLTQEAVVPTPVTAACGSQDDPMTTDVTEGADNPNVGCYTNDFVDFTCARIPVDAKGKVNYQMAYGPTATTAFVNGCEGGYVPGLREMTGSMTTVCHGLCAAKKTDSSPANTGNLKGDPTALGKLHTKAAPAAGDATCQIGKKGTAQGDECRFTWFFNVSNGMVPESQYNDTLGLCFRPANYTYDDDGNMGTPAIPFPKCNALPATVRDGAGAITPPTNCTCDANESCTGTGCPQGLAHEWGCYGLTETLGPAFSGKKVPVKVQGEFRLNYGEGKAFRHILQ